MAVSSSPAGASASTFYVAATGSVGAGTSCSSPDYVGATHAAIQSAIDAASTGNTVYICAGTYSISTRLEVTKSLTIQGAGARVSTLDGLQTTQIMIIQDNNLTANSGSEITVNIDGVGFINGRAGAFTGNSECVDGNRCGGAIFIERESRANISNSYFRNNYADFVGGAVSRFIGDYLTVPSTITNSTFESNNGRIDGGAVATLFGFGLTIDTSTFYGNRVTTRSAAAVIANFATATINNSTFVDNTGPAGTTVLFGGLTVTRSILAQSSASMIRICASNSQSISGNRGNLVTDNSCTGVTTQFPATPASDSAIVNFSDLKLGTLAFRGYDNKTIPLLAGSVALNLWSGCTGTDQVGIARPQDSGCDVGAAERSSSQTLNTPTGWTYPSSSMDRTIAATMAVASPAIDPAGQGVEYRSSTQSVCTIASNGTITAVSVGTCTVHADAPGHLLRDESTVTTTITVTASTTTTSTTTTSTTVPTSSSTIAPVTQTGRANNGNTTTNAPVGQNQVERSSGSTPSSTTSTSTTTTVPAPEAPDASPGQASAFIAGQNVDLQVAREENALIVTGAGIEATIYGLSSTGERIDLDDDGNLRLNAGDSISLEASGFNPGDEVQAWMFSTPEQLGTLSVDESGNVSGNFPVPSSISSGDHRFVLKSANASGDDFVIGIGIAVGSISNSSTTTRVLIAIPIALAVLVGLIVPTTIRRRRLKR